MQTLLEISLIVPKLELKNVGIIFGVDTSATKGLDTVFSADELPLV